MREMQLPGMTIVADLSIPESAERILNSIFLTGGVVLSQVSQMTGLKSHVIQNWVKRGFVSSPVSKKYSKRQFCRIVIINMLKDSLQIDTITKLISYINGELDDESDDIIDDSILYNLFVHIASALASDKLLTFDNIDTAVRDALSRYNEPNEESRLRLFNVLKVMTAAFLSAQYKKMADSSLISAGVI
ncbi:MAG: DUF1836 domain-containing protein [Bacillota bacterium]|nr:DUF1836 domain-containing protein [Bacillota bacterium]